MLQQQLDVGAMVGEHRDPDTRADAKWEAGGFERRRELLLHALDARENVVAAGHDPQEHGELVAAEPRREVVATSGAPQPGCDLLQHDVADVVAETVVDLLDPIEVDERYRVRPAMSLRVCVREAQ